MLAYILGIIKRSNKGITNRGSLRDFKSEQTYYKLGQKFQIRTKRFQIETEIVNWCKRDYKPGRGFQIRARIKNLCRTQAL